MVTYPHHTRTHQPWNSPSLPAPERDTDAQLIRLILFVTDDTMWY